MNSSLSMARALLTDVRQAKTNMELVVFPPYVYLSLCAELLKGSACFFGAQTVSAYTDGAYTGEVSATMLKDLGCRYVIIGHSERRQYWREDDTMILAQCQRALDAQLLPILCVGETLAEREDGYTLSVIKKQLAVVKALKDNYPALQRLVLAYEPVWAIGTGKAASPQDAQIVHAFIRSELMSLDDALGQNCRILYGGSVKPENAKALFAMSDIDGALVGGASLSADSFLKMAR